MAEQTTLDRLADKARLEWHVLMVLPFDRLAKFDADVWRRVVRAVLTELREPTEAMIRAADDTPGIQAVDNCIVISKAHGIGLPEEHQSPNSPLQQAWRAMIDSLLAERPKETG